MTDEPTRDAMDIMTLLAAAVSASGLNASVTLSLFPNDRPADEKLAGPVEIDLPGMMMCRVLELPEGTIMSGEQEQLADYVIIGGVLVKNRYGPVMGCAKAAARDYGADWSYISSPGRPAARAMIHLGTKFDIGQLVSFPMNGRYGQGAVWAITQFRDREPSYFVRPDEESAKLLGHDHDVSRDEGDLDAVNAAGDGQAEEPASISRSAAEEAALANLTQAIVSGSAGGDEIRAVIENDPHLANVICRGLDRIDPLAVEGGRSLSALRREAMSGTLTSRRLIRALAAAAQGRFTMP